MRIAREPVLMVATLLAPLVATILLFVTDMSGEAQAGWNALALAVGGIVTAAVVARDRLAPAIMGFVQALATLLPAYGWDLTAEQVTSVTGFVALVVGMWLRTQVTAKVADDGSVRAVAA